MENLLIAVLVAVIAWLIEGFIAGVKKRAGGSHAHRPSAAMEPEIDTATFNFDLTGVTSTPSAPAPPPVPLRRVEYTPLPAEGERMTVDTTDDATAPMEAVTEADAEARAAHYARWRQAFIDMEVLTRKDI